MSDDNNTCFLISPIGEKDSDTFKKFKKVLDFIIKPAIKDSGYGLEVIRADDIKKPGSWINDILKNIHSSFIVIADLTDQNPNVFYELGVRHSLSPRTILIAQSIDEIPSDLRSYRSIVYELSLEGAHKFKKELFEYLKQIYQNPNESDNPVLDHLPDNVNSQIKELERINASLNKQIIKMGTLKEISKEIESNNEDISTRLKRIKIIENMKSDFPFEVGLGYDYPTRQSNFRFLIKYGEKDQYFFISNPYRLDLEKELADIRVLMELVSRVSNESLVFIIATNSDLKKEKDNILKKFNQMKLFLKEEHYSLFSLEIWDKETILAKELELGIKL